MNYAVVDLGFGDSGKGATVDHLCRTRDVGLVVRFNGGGQAGHNVVTADGRHHTFSQWGSGTLAGVPTFLSRFMVVDPLALVPEAEHLKSIGVEDPWSMLTIDPQALVVTPWHRALQRLRETMAGDARHGTCGMGIGEVVRQSIDQPFSAVRWGDLRNPDRVGVVMSLAQSWCAGQANTLRHNPSALTHPWMMNDRPAEVAREFEHVAWQVRTKAWVSVMKEDTPFPAVVFEGAQGVLLDQDYGFHPHTTWSTTTFTNADTLATEAGMEKPYRLGVTRAYSYRHGPGPFPTEDPAWDPEPEWHNGHDDWRGGCRYGPLDLVLLRYAVEACGGVDGIAVSHLDEPHGKPVDVLSTPLGPLDHLVPARTPDLDRQEAIGGILRHSRPATWLDVSVPVAVDYVTGIPVVIESHGPTALDRREKAGVMA